MLVLVTGWMHELVWLSRVKCCTRHMDMEINDSYFIKWYFQLNDELIKKLVDNKNELEPENFWFWVLQDVYVVKFDPWLWVVCFACRVVAWLLHYIMFAIKSFYQS